jgi:uncharacterized membrane protein
MTTPVAGEYRDRATGLIVFGVFEILLGALCLLLALLMPLSLMMASRQTGALRPLVGLIFGTGFYALAGTVLVWLGIGSLLARRWARALWVCLSGVGLGVGLMSTPFMIYVAAQFPRVMASQGQPALPAAALLIARVFMIGFMLLFYIVIPAALFFFYRSPHVKRTCEVRDPRVRWTDCCPLPVLALSLFTSFGAFSFLALLAFRGVFPLFGIFVAGAIGPSVILVIAGAMLYAGWGLYRLRLPAWWLLLAVHLFVGASTVVTFWHADLLSLYTAMGLDHQVAIAASQFGQLALIKWFYPVWFLPWLGWILYVRRYFPKASPPAAVF